MYKCLHNKNKKHIKIQMQPNGGFTISDCFINLELLIPKIGYDIMSYKF